MGVVTCGDIIGGLCVTWGDPSVPTMGSRATSGTVTPLLRQYRGRRFVHTYGSDVNAAVVPDTASQSPVWLLVYRHVCNLGSWPG